MIKLNGEIVKVGHFPDGTLLLKEEGVWCGGGNHKIEWYFENNEELVTLIFLVKHLKNYNKTRKIDLYLPYIPNARQDRVKEITDVFTLKYFTEIINDLEFNSVMVLDHHSNVSVALINHVSVQNVEPYIKTAIRKCRPDTIFFPDEGAMKRYSENANMPYAFGLKKRDWKTGKIDGLDIVGGIDDIKNKNILIIDDICCRGGTFFHSAKKLKELGANNIYLYITHCENTILESDFILDGKLIERIYTTNSIFTKEHEKIEVFEL